MRLRRLAKFALLLGLAGDFGCRADSTSSKLNVSATEFDLHAEALYKASKDLQAFLAIDRTTDRLRPLIEICFREYLWARDWATTPEEKRLAEAYGAGLSAAPRGLSEQIMVEYTRKMEYSTPKGAAVVVGQLSQSSLKANQAFEEVNIKLQEADGVFVMWVRSQRR